MGTKLYSHDLRGPLDPLHGPRVKNLCPKALLLFCFCGVEVNVEIALRFSSKVRSITTFTFKLLLLT